MKSIMFVLSMLFYSWGMMANQGEVKTTLAAMKSQIEQGKAVTVNDWAVYFPGNESLVISVMENWLKDSKCAVRSNAVMIMGRLAACTKTGFSRTQALDVLFKACEDPDACIGALSLQYLKQIKWQYFTSAHKATLRHFLNELQPSLEDYLYLAGYMYAIDHAGVIRDLISSGKLNNIQLWQAQLALARLGDVQNIEECIKIANSATQGDDFIKVIVPGLIYTRQKCCIDVLVTILKASEKVRIASKQNQLKPVPGSYNIVVSLAQIIEGFPAKVQKEEALESSNQHDVLLTIVQWFDKHADYEIKEDNKVGFRLASVDTSN